MPYKDQDVRRAYMAAYLREYLPKWREQNREILRDKSAAYRARNREIIREKQRARRAQRNRLQLVAALTSEDAITTLESGESTVKRAALEGTATE